MGAITTSAALGALATGATAASAISANRTERKNLKQQQQIAVKNHLNLLEEQLASRRAKLAASSMTYSGSAANANKSFIKSSLSDLSDKNQSYINSYNKLLRSGSTNNINAVSSLLGAGKILK